MVAGGGGGGGGGGGNCDPSKEPAPNGPPDPKSPCADVEAPDPQTPYKPTAVNLPASRPFISLADYKAAPANSPIVEKFKDFADGAISRGENADEFSASDAVVMFARTGDTKYIDDAIKREDSFVESENAKIAANGLPRVTDDSYLDVGSIIEELALTYDYGFSHLSDAQKQAWKSYGDTTISNLWSPFTATWGNHAVGADSWSAWALNDPGDNYYFSFILATQMWALATKSSAWIDFLQKYKFPQVESYYAAIPGGGSREGSGYGAAQRRLWENARMWRSSTGEDLPVIRNHARESIEYWVNATVPTLDSFAPIGDQSRVSLPEMYDYQENLVREAAMAAPGTAEAGHGLWWIHHNSLADTLRSNFNLRQALPVPAATEAAPTALTYHATGVGQFFARSSWAEDATWMQLTAGPYDQSHAHEDQGGFTLYRNTWLAVTSNVWSGSGLQGGGGGNGGSVPDLGTGVNNVVRFEKAGGQVIGQNHSTSTMTEETLAGGLVKVHANLTPAYSSHANEVKSWTRDLEFQGNDLHVHDGCQVGAGVTPVFEVNVPVQPVDNGAGTITAGALKITASPSYGVKLVDMTSFNTSDDHEFEKGWRVDLTNPAGCEFDVNLNAGP